MSDDLTVPAPATAVLTVLIRERLPSEFADVRVCTKIPNPRPGRIIRISRRPGGGMGDGGHTDVVLTLVECWAATEDDAEDLANLARAILKSARSHTVDGTFIRRWKEDSGPYSWPDESGQERFQFTGELRLKIG